MMSFSLSESYGKRAQRRKQRAARRDECFACPHAGECTVACTPLCAWMRLLRSAIRVESTTEAYHATYAPLKTRFNAIHVCIAYRTSKRFLEALELLLLALHLNPEQTWREVMESVNGVHLPWLEPFDEIVPRVHIELSDLRLWERPSKQLLQLLEMNFARSVQYRLTRRWLVKRYAIRGGSITGYHVPLTLAVMKGTRIASYDDEVASAITHISQSLMQSESSPLRLEKVELEWRMDMVSTTHPFYRLQQVAGLDVRIKVIREDPQPMLQALAQQGVPIDTCVVASCAYLRLDVSAWPIQSLRLREIQFDADCFESDVTLRSVARVLLDPMAPSPVEHITINGGPDRTWAPRMVDALRSLHPATASPLPPPPSVNRLTSLSLRITLWSGEYDAVVQLLQLIGGRIECLSLVSDTPVQLGDAEIQPLLAACPSLRCLSVRFAHMLRIQSLINAYELGLGESLQSLVLHCRHRGDDTGVLALLRASNDPASAVHHTLRDLEYKSHVDSGVADEAVALLQLNSTLRHVCVTVPKDKAAEYHAQVDALDGQRVPQLRATLPITHRLALLSALRGRVDGDACRLVLQFSGDAVRRRVCLHEAYE